MNYSIYFLAADNSITHNQINMYTNSNLNVIFLNDIHLDKELVRDANFASKFLSCDAVTTFVTTSSVFCDHSPTIFTMPIAQRCSAGAHTLPMTKTKTQILIKCTAVN